MPNKNLTVAAVVIVLALVGLLVWQGKKGGEPAPVAKNLEALAQCLQNKEVTMYGAEWCSHCQNQKKMFGEAFSLIPYVECPNEPQTCLNKGVEGYPTWIFPDGQKLVGEQPLEKLAQAAGCAF